jgi:hypothetical protein
VGGGAEKRKKLRVKVLHGKQEMPLARARVSRTRELSAFLLVGDGGKHKKNESGSSGALVLNGHKSNSRYRLRHLPAAPLVVRRRYLIVMPRPLAAAPCRYFIVVPRP